MLNAGTNQEGLWGSDPLTDGAQAFLGASADSPFEAAMALLVLLALGLVVLAVTGARLILAGEERTPEPTSMLRALPGSVPPSRVTNASEVTMKEVHSAYSKLRLSVTENRDPSERWPLYVQGSGFKFD